MVPANCRRWLRSNLHVAIRHATREPLLPPVAAPPIRFVARPDIQAMTSTPLLAQSGHWLLCCNSMFVVRYWRRCVDVRRHHLDQLQETRAYYRLLRHLLTEEVQCHFKEEHRPLTEPMSDLMRRLEDASRKSRNDETESQWRQSGRITGDVLRRLQWSRNAHWMTRTLREQSSTISQHWGCRFALCCAGAGARNTRKMVGAVGIEPTTSPVWREIHQYKNQTRRNVRFWPKADMPFRTARVRFRG